MSTENQSLFEKEISPFKQLMYTAACVVGFQLLYFAFNFKDHSLKTAQMYYTIGITFALVFGIFNSVLSISTKDQNKYWGQSVMCYFILCVVSVSLAYLLSKTHIDDAGSFRWIYFVFSFGYILFLAIVSTMKRIVLLAQKQDKRLRGEE
jgi:hypothetical protein